MKFLVFFMVSLFSTEAAKVIFVEMASGEEFPAVELIGRKTIYGNIFLLAFTKRKIDLNF